MIGKQTSFVAIVIFMTQMQQKYNNKLTCEQKQMTRHILDNDKCILILLILFLLDDSRARFATECDWLSLSLRFCLLLLLRLLFFFELFLLFLVRLDLRGGVRVLTDLLLDL